MVKKIITIAIIVIAIAVNFYIQYSEFNDAVKLFERGNYGRAKQAFEDYLSDHMIDFYGDDSREKIQECEKAMENNTFNRQLDSIKNSNVGDTVTLGTYEQDGDESNGKEFLEWIVLDKQEDKALLITNCVIEKYPFNNDDDNFGISWARSSIRAWLNDGFIKDNLKGDELNRHIMKTTVVTGANPVYGTEAEADSLDRVFLLSADEATLYFASDEARRAPGTSKFSSWDLDQDGNCTWWLRTPGENKYSYMNYATFVKADGSISYSGASKDWSHYDYQGVRPAMWIGF